MTRSNWKPKYINDKLFNKVLNLNDKEKNKAIKIWHRNSIVVENFIGMSFNVHNGKIFSPIKVSPEMVGHKFGEFAQTRKQCIFKKKSKLKKKK